MGKRGPARTPTAKLEKRGSPLARNRSWEPTPERDRPQRPEWLDDLAAEYWDHLVPILEGMGVLTIADGDALMVLANALARYQRAMVVLASEGEEMESGKRRPAAYTVKDSEATIQRMMARFGLDPASRASIEVGVSKAKDGDSARDRAMRLVG